MPLQQTSGNDTSDAYGGGAAVVPTYIEDVFSTYLYTGNGTQQTIVNGIDLSTYGGMVWEKQRTATSANYIIDTARGMNNVIYTNGTSAQFSVTGASANSNGYTSALGWGGGNTIVGWTFRKQPKFFDVVTYTGASPSSVTVNHNLGSTPGCIIIKCISDTVSWAVYHKSTGLGKILYLNGTQAASTDTTFITAVTSTSFTVGDNTFTNNSPSLSYVAYLFASNAGGFGSAGTDNVITCGGFTTSSYYATVNLGYEPQFVLTKRTDSSTDGGWYMADTMRGLTANANATFATLFSNTSAAETQDGNLQLTSTGFVFGGAATGTYIYIAIRRGPMKTPTDATKVFSPQIYTGTSATRTLTTAGFPVDLVITDPRSGAFGIGYFDRLRGATNYLNSAGTGAEGVGSDSLTSFASMNGYTADADSSTALINYTPNYVNWLMRRAPGFFDEVCFTSDSGGGSNGNQNHNLGVTPELMIFKARGTTSDWLVSSSAYGASWQYFKTYLNLTNAKQLDGSGVANANSSTFSVFNTGQLSASSTYVAYLFATCAGVSKVGTYTGNGTTQTIDCGFAGGVRFVLIKRTDASGGWYVYDTARGMTTLTDPYLFLNSAAAESATLGSVTTVSTGFALNSTILAAINVNGGSYLFLAIA
jgi:hypothetical protein